MESIARRLPKAKKEKQIQNVRDQLRTGRSRTQVNSITFLFCVNNIGKEFENYFIVNETAKPDNNVMYYVS
jgi:hypothetical protein